MNEAIEALKEEGNLYLQTIDKFEYEEDNPRVVKPISFSFKRTAFSLFCS